MSLITVNVDSSLPEKLVQEYKTLSYEDKAVSTTYVAYNQAQNNYIKVVIPPFTSEEIILRDLYNYEKVETKGLNYNANNLGIQTFTYNPLSTTTTQTSHNNYEYESGDVSYKSSVTKSVEKPLFPTLPVGISTPAPTLPRPVITPALTTYQTALTSGRTETEYKDDGLEYKTTVEYKQPAKQYVSAPSRTIVSYPSVTVAPTPVTYATVPFTPAGVPVSVAYEQPPTVLKTVSVEPPKSVTFEQPKTVYQTVSVEPPKTTVYQSLPTRNVIQSVAYEQPPTIETVTVKPPSPVQKTTTTTTTTSVPSPVPVATTPFTTFSSSVPTYHVSYKL